MPTLNTQTVTGFALHGIELGISVQSHDSIPTDSLKVQFTNLSPGDSFSAGQYLGNGVWEVSASDLPHLQFLSPFSGDRQLTVTVASSEPNGNNQARISKQFTVHIEPPSMAEAPAPEFTATIQSATQNNALPIHFHLTNHDTASSNRVTVTISGVPQGGRFSSGVETAPGVWSFNQSDIESSNDHTLLFIPPRDLSGSVNFLFNATTENAAGAERSSVQYIQGNIQQVPQMPIILSGDTIGRVVGDVVPENEKYLNPTVNLKVLAGDMNNTDSLVGQLTGLPAGVRIFSDGVQIDSVFTADGAVFTFDKTQLQSHITIESAYEGNYTATLTVTAHSANSNSSNMQISQAMDFRFLYPNDPELSIPNPNPSLLVTMPSHLNIPADSTPASLRISIANLESMHQGANYQGYLEISGIPSGVFLTHGTLVGDKWIVDLAHASNLQIVNASHLNASNVPLQVHAVVIDALGNSQIIEANAGTTFSEQPDLSFGTFPFPPIVIAATGPAAADAAIPLSIHAFPQNYQDTNPIVLTISNVPEGAVLSAGQYQGHGVWSLQQSDLADLQISVPPGNLDATYQLSITATENFFGVDFTSPPQLITLQVPHQTTLPAGFTMIRTEIPAAPSPTQHNPQTVNVDTLQTNLNFFGDSTHDTIIITGHNPFTLTGTSSLPNDTSGSTNQFLNIDNQFSALDIIEPGTTKFILTTDSGVTYTFSNIQHIILSNPPTPPPPVDAQPPHLLSINTVGLENATVQIDISPQPDNVIVTLYGIPSNATLSNAAQDPLLPKPDGTYQLTGSQLAGLQITPPANAEPIYHLAATAQFANEPGHHTPLATTFFTTTVQAVADVHAFSVHSASGLALTGIHLSIVPTNPAQAIRDDLSVTITGLEAGDRLSVGHALGDGAWFVNIQDLPNLQLLSPFSGERHLEVAWNAADGNHAMAAMQQKLDVTILPNLLFDPYSAVAPQLMAEVGPSDNPASAFLNIQVATEDSHGGNLLSVLISGLPTDGTGMLSAGTQISPGVWELKPNELANLHYFYMPTQPENNLDISGIDSYQVFNFEVIATSVNHFGEPATAHGTLYGMTGAYTGTPPSAISPYPALFVAEHVVGVSDLGMPLTIEAYPGDFKSGDDIRIVITNLPAGAILSAGRSDGYGSWVLTPAQLSNLQLSIPDAYTEQGTYQGVFGIFAIDNTTGLSVRTDLHVSVSHNADFPLSFPQPRMPEAFIGDDHLVLTPSNTSHAPQDVLLTLDLSNLPPESTAIQGDDAHQTIILDGTEDFTLTGYTTVTNPHGNVSETFLQINTATDGKFSALNINQSGVTHYELTTASGHTIHFSNISQIILQQATSAQETTAPSIPRLNVANSEYRVFEGSIVNLGVSLQNDLTIDPNQVLVTISGIPSGIHLSSGFYDMSQETWKVSAAELNSLKMILPENYSGDLPALTFTAVNTEHGISVSSNASVHLHVLPTADPIQLNVNLPFGGTAQNPIPALQPMIINVSLANYDPLILNNMIIVNNVQPGDYLSTADGLSAGQYLGNGQWQVSAYDLHQSNNQLRFVSAFAGQQQLSVSITNTDHESQATFAVPLTIHVADARANLGYSAPVTIAEPPSLIATLAESANPFDPAMHLHIALAGMDPLHQETLYVTIQDPHGGTFSQGVQLTNGEWLLMPNQLDDVRYAPGAHNTAVDFVITAHTMNAFGSQAQTQDQLTMTLAAPITATPYPSPAPPFLLTAPVIGISYVGNPLPIKVEVPLSYGNSDHIMVRIANVPSDCVLSTGTVIDKQNNSSVWMVPASAIANLQISMAQDARNHPSFDLQISLVDGNLTFVDNIPLSVTMFNNSVELYQHYALPPVPEGLPIFSANPPDYYHAGTIAAGHSDTPTVSNSNLLDGYKLNVDLVNDPTNPNLVTEIDGNAFGNTLIISGDGMFSFSGTASINSANGESTHTFIALQHVRQTELGSLDVTASGADSINYSLVTAQGHQYIFHNISHVVMADSQQPSTTIMPLDHTGIPTFAVPDLQFGYADPIQIPAIPLHIAEAGDTVYNVTIHGVPDGVNLILANPDSDAQPPFFTNNQWYVTTTNNIVPALSMQTPPGFNGEVKLTISAQAFSPLQADGGVVYSGISQTSFHIAVSASPTLPNIPVTFDNHALTATHTSMQAINLDLATDHIASFEHLSMRISNVRAGDGFNLGHYDAAEREWVLNSSELQQIHDGTQLQMITPFVGARDLTFTFVDFDPNFTTPDAALHSEGLPQTLHLLTIARDSGWPATPPLVFYSTGAIYDSPLVDLGLSVRGQDYDQKDDTITVSISGAPANSVFNHGTQLADGSWLMTKSDLTGLQLALPQDFVGNYALQVTATTINGWSATAQTTEIIEGRITAQAANATVPSNFASELDSPPVLVLGINQGLKGTRTPLHIQVIAQDANPVSVEISNLPPTALLSAGTQHADGTWTLTQDQLAGLQIFTPNSSTAPTYFVHVEAHSGTLTSSGNFLLRLGNPVEPPLTGFTQITETHSTSEAFTAEGVSTSEAFTTQAIPTDTTPLDLGTLAGALRLEHTDGHTIHVQGFATTIGTDGEVTSYKFVDVNTARADQDFTKLTFTEGGNTQTHFVITATDSHHVEHVIMVDNINELIVGKTESFSHPLQLAAPAQAPIILNFSAEHGNVSLADPIYTSSLTTDTSSNINVSPHDAAHDTLTLAAHDTFELKAFTTTLDNHNNVTSSHLFLDMNTAPGDQNFSKLGFTQHENESLHFEITTTQNQQLYFDDLHHILNQ